MFPRVFSNIFKKTLFEWTSFQSLDLKPTGIIKKQKLNFAINSKIVLGFLYLILR